ncbi:hypothetical protein [Aquimarina algiphila]|uniref:hypothetical protein n=1 Tax=Aquimarina algiphila TaxID=2047982 RepID=UPI0024938BC6|nr:hypothetical protein [Aquimarina algiphila]
MKNIFTILFLCIIPFSYAQETLKQKFKIPYQIEYGENEYLYLQKKEASPRNQQAGFDKKLTKFTNRLNKYYPLNKTVNYSFEKNINGIKTRFDQSIIVDKQFIDDQIEKFSNEKTSIAKNIGPCQSCSWMTLFKKKLKTTKRKGFVKFEEDTIYVNTYLNDSDKESGRETILFYKLKNRQSLKLRFNAITITGVTIPIKYRFKGKGDIEEEFSTSFNLNFLAGYSFGKQLFFHRKKVGNKTNTTKWTVGAFFGGNAVELNEGNSRLEEGKVYNQGALSYGGALGYSFNKINVAAFVGWDRIVGANRDVWKYNDKVWIGFGVGYDLFKF